MKSHLTLALSPRGGDGSRNSVERGAWSEVSRLQKPGEEPEREEAKDQNRCAGGIVPFGDCAYSMRGADVNQEQGSADIKEH